MIEYNKPFHDFVVYFEEQDFIFRVNKIILNQIPYYKKFFAENDVGMIVVEGDPFKFEKLLDDLYLSIIYLPHITASNYKYFYSLGFHEEVESWTLKEIRNLVEKLRQFVEKKISRMPEITFDPDCHALHKFFEDWNTDVCGFVFYYNCLLKKEGKEYKKDKRLLTVYKILFKKETDDIDQAMDEMISIL